MSDKLYDLMDWAKIEAIVYSEENNPRAILGPRVMKIGVLIQCFFPGADRVTLKNLSEQTSHLMTMQDESGFFAVLLPDKAIPNYIFNVERGKTHQQYRDPYAFPSQLDEATEKAFNNGICYDIYQKLGAHPITVNGIKGTCFAVWAPNAVRVSVVGDFNEWDGRVHPMQFHENSGIHELFIPELKAGELYKYELKMKDSTVYLKADPFANAAQLRPETASVVADLSGYKWKDAAYLRARKKIKHAEAPAFVYEVHLGSWLRTEAGGFFNYQEIAPKLAEYVNEMGYTHIELMPVMEHPYDQSWGYQVTGYYAPTSRFGTPQDFMAFIDIMHQQGIGVILDWVPAHFPRDTFGLSAFDGTCLYEHLDPRQGYHPHWGTLIFNYGRPQVKNFLIANAIFWTEIFHIDGIRMDAVASMLYLDYGKNDGEWVANIFGGNENLEAVEFLKHLNSIFKKKYPDVLLIAEESTAWPKITESVEEDGLGFDYKWNMGWMNDFLGYMRYDPVFRGAHHNELTFSMVYAYSENFLLSLSHDEFVHGKGSLINKMPGDAAQKFANVRAALGFMIAHPGKKLLFMGQDFAQEREWSEQQELDWGLLQEGPYLLMKRYVKDMIALYKDNPALYEQDYHPDGFEWINTLEWEKNILTFVRKAKNKKDCLLIVCNFSALSYEAYQVGVPYSGKYKEICSSDAIVYGGSGVVNPRVKMSRKQECDDRPHSISIKVPPLGVSIFKYSKVEQKAADNKTAKSKKKTGAGNKRDLKKELELKIAQEEKK